ncbi:MAG: repair protein RecN [Frankiaceae bacterium]|nr:repair protein RecN [Frankiaceae bacterium]
MGGRARTADGPIFEHVIEEVRISALGVIDDAVLDLAPGFTVVTGETGAGKTMVVQSLGLLSGARGDGGAVRSGRPRAVVEARLVVDVAGHVAERAREVGAELDDETESSGVLLVHRLVSAEGRSRAALGGRAVPLAVLTELVGQSVAVHGQSGQLRLLRPAEQRAALDAYAGAPVAEAMAGYSTCYTRLLAARRELAEIVERERERAAEAELLRLGLADVERIDPQPGEDEALEAEIARLSHAESLLAAASGAHDALAGADDDRDAAVPALVGLSTARRLVAGVEAHDAELSALGARLEEVRVLAADVAADLASYAGSVELDPARIESAAERAAALARLCRTHDTTIDGVLAWAERSARRLLELDGSGARREELETEVAALEAELARGAGALAAARRAAATSLGTAVTGELATLAMANAEVSVAVGSVEVPPGADEAGLLVDVGDGNGPRRLAYGPTGVDDVEIRLGAHVGAEPRPLNRGASGGELSRVMLALEVVLADAAGDGGAGTMIFDEVDSGVGGSAAVEIGRRLAKLAEHRQVICVTHLPQVAAFADRHLMVQKSDDGSVTTSGVRRLDHRDRIRELSRMLAGRSESSLAQGHAEELLGEAARAKAS